MNAERFSVVALSLLLVWMVALLAVACASRRKGAPFCFFFFSAFCFRPPRLPRPKEKKNAHPLSFCLSFSSLQKTNQKIHAAAGLKEAKKHARIIRL